MKRIENHCVGCADVGLHCLGRSCPNRNVEVHYCDICGWEIGDEIYGTHGEELCEECYAERYPDESATERLFGTIKDMILARGRRRTTGNEQEAV